jgi:hypothetical protein
MPAAPMIPDIQMPELHPAAEICLALPVCCFMGAIGLAAAQKKVALPERRRHFLPSTS